MVAAGSAPNKGFGELFGEAKGKLDELQAGLASIFPAMPGMPAHPLIGWPADRLNKTRLMASCMIIASLSVYLLFSNTAEWQLWLALVLFTVVEGLFPVTWATVGDFFGRSSFAKVRGSMSFLYMWGSVIGPVIAGAVYDRTQSYSPLMWGLISLCWATALIYAVLVKPSSASSPANL